MNKKNYNDQIIIKSNIKDFFTCDENITEIKGKNETEENDYLPLNQLNNINNSNSILIILNTIDESIIQYIIDKFENMNYKNKNKFKRNKNKIIKLLCFDQNDHWLNIYKQFKISNSVNYESIIFYDIRCKLTENLETYIIKKPIIPIILTINYSIIIFNSEDLESLLMNKIKFITITFPCKI